MQEAQKVGLPALTRGILKIFSKTQATKKYQHLLNLLIEAGFLTAGNVVNEEKYEISLFYLQPWMSESKGTVITFSEFADYVSTFPDSLSQRFSQSLKLWGSTQAGHTAKAKTMTLAQIETILATEYNRIWNDWYPSDGTVNKATLQIEVGDSASFYRRSQDCINIYVPECNFSDFEQIIDGRKYACSKMGWYINQAELVHEMLHEYQFKMIKAPSEEGKALLAKKGRTFDGEGHDEKFFSAIVEKSSYFKLTPEELLADL